MIAAMFNDSVQCVLWLVESSFEMEGAWTWILSKGTTHMNSHVAWLMRQLGHRSELTSAVRLARLTIVCAIVSLVIFEKWYAVRNNQMHYRDMLSLDRTIFQFITLFSLHRPGLHRAYRLLWLMWRFLIQECNSRAWMRMSPVYGYVNLRQLGQIIRLGTVRTDLFGYKVIFRQFQIFAHASLCRWQKTIFCTGHTQYSPIFTEYTGFAAYPLEFFYKKCFVLMVRSCSSYCPFHA